MALFDGTAVADEQPQPAVAAVSRIAGHQQVAQISRDLRIARVGITLLQETRHLARRIGDQHGQKKIVAVAPAPRRCADRKGVDILENCGVFDAIEDPRNS